MILTFLDFFRRGLPTHKKISFLGGPAHFVTYGDGSVDGLVDNNNALTMHGERVKNAFNWLRRVFCQPFTYLTTKKKKMDRE
jgi:hypothetical protein